MLVNLLRVPPCEPALEGLRAAGLVVRRARPWELTQVRAFVRDNFSRAWADEISVGLVSQPVTVFVAVPAASSVRVMATVNEPLAV